MAINPEMLAELTRNRRAALGLTKKAFAKRLHVHQSTVTRWERGIFDPTFVRLANLIFGLVSNGTQDAVLQMWMRRAVLAERSLQEVRTTLDQHTKRVTSG